MRADVRSRGLGVGVGACLQTMGVVMGLAAVMGLANAGGCWIACKQAPTTEILRLKIACKQAPTGENFQSSHSG